MTCFIIIIAFITSRIKEFLVSGLNRYFKKTNIKPYI